MGQALASYAEERLSEYQKAQESVDEFRRVLQDMADTLSKTSENRPLIVVIDELDRCRPSYAVELLEVAKHLFAVNHIVFVLAVNRAELTHSIKALYGSGFDAEGYMRRFFDVDFRLPEPDRAAFIDATLAAININKYIERTKDNDGKEYAGVSKTLLHGFFAAPDLKLRTIAQAIHRLGLVFASLRSDQRSFLIGTTVALIVRTIAPELYHPFVNGEVSDLKVVETVRSRADAKALQKNRGGSWFEASIIVAAREEKIFESYPVESISSPLLQQYRNLAATKEPDDASHGTAREHAEEVIELVEHLQRTLHRPNSGVGFRHSVQRLELLSPGLISE